MKILINGIKKRDGVITHLSWKKEGDECFKVSRKSELISKIISYRNEQDVEIETYTQSGSPKSVSIINNKYLRTGADGNDQNDLLDLPICEIGLYESIVELFRNFITMIKKFFN